MSDLDRAAPAARTAFVSTFPPQQCGLATFCQDHRRALEAAAPLHHPVVPVAKAGEDIARGALARIDRDDAGTYRAAARTLNEAGVDVVCIQHEFGIYGGPSGQMLGELLDNLDKPVVTILHTVLPDPNDEQRAAMEDVLRVSARVVTMAERGRAILRETYGARDEQVVVIPHGYPERAAQDREALKRAYGYEGRKVLLTFGLLSPGKGIETAIEALPQVAARCPDALYVVAGATHPEVKRQQGETYREGLQARAEELGVAGHLRLADGYLSLDALLDHLQMADAYVTPYPNVRQITSGTLSYAFGMGLPIVSTPYWHAEELLADGLGRLVPFSDPAAMGEALAGLLADDEGRAALSARVLAAADGMSWPAAGRRFERLFATVAAEARGAADKVHHVDFGRAAEAEPAQRFGHLLRMTDGVGIAQHARFKVPDRQHGYCVDDCARVLIAAAEEAGRPGMPEALSDAVSACAAFVEHAWNPGADSYRNFMAYDRSWLERSGSQDSNGRTLWALGWTSARAWEDATADWAEHLYLRTRHLRDALTSPRALAFAVLGEAERRRRRDRDETGLFDRFGVLMMHQWEEVALKRSAEREAEGHAPWRWFETSLSYDNARLCEALLAAAEVRGRKDWRAAALSALDWLWSVQDRGDHLNMVATACFGRPYVSDERADEQPVEATALVDACAAAYRATGDALWRRRATDAFAWFGGRNRLGASLVDVTDGACRDGLHADRVNGNCGAESVLAYAQAAASLSRLTRERGAPRTGLAAVAL